MTSWAGPRRPARGLLALAILLLALPGCGRKGPPVAPRPVAPAAPSPVRAELEDGAIVVTWARPTRNENGTPLTNLQEFRLYRAVSQGTPRPTGPQPAFSLLATVRADHPDNATVMGDLYAFRDEGGGRELTPGTRYIYRVQAVNLRALASFAGREVTAPHQAWVADITYIRLREEFIFLAVVLDAFSRRVVGWELGESLQASLVLRALNRALAERPVPPGIIHHSDQGVQYASADLVERLLECGFLISMSRKGSPWENGRVESFMKTLKAEEVSLKQYRNLEEARRSIGHLSVRHLWPLKNSLFFSARHSRQSGP
jgi:predicted small lipoprotein YifL